MKGIEIPATYLIKKPKEQQANFEKKSIWNQEISLGPKVSLKEKLHLYQMLSILLKSGLGIMDCMEVLLDQLPKKQIREILIQVQKDLTAGIPLSQAFEKRGDVFTAFEIKSISMAEQTGRMAEILASLAQLFEKRIRLKRKISQALSYPIAVIVVAFLVLSFMIAFVVPMFEDIFSRFDSELPPITDAILKLSHTFTSHIGKIVGALGLFMGGILYLRKKPFFRKYQSAFILRLPLLGKLILKLQLSRFCYTFALLLNSKVNMDKSLDLLEQIIPFYPLQSVMGEIRKDVIGGASLYEAISKFQIFPSFFRQIIKVGEKTARIEQMLENLGKNLEEESEAGIAQLTQFLEPVLIIVLGLLVAIILVAMYLPMFELSNAIAT